MCNFSDSTKLPMSTKLSISSPARESSWSPLVQKVKIRTKIKIKRFYKSFSFPEIVDGNVKMTLGMIWTIILR